MCRSRAIKFGRPTPYPMKLASPSQFGIRRVLVLMTAVAACCALVVRLNAPWIVQVSLAVYLILFAGWMVLRIPSLYSKFASLRARSREIADRRRKLKSEASQSQQE